MAGRSEIVVACALQKEARGLQRHWRGDWPLAVTGLGADRTARNLDRRLAEAKPRLLVFTGMAGQLDPSLELGEFCFPRTWMLESGLSYSAPPVLVRRLEQQGWPVEGAGLTVRVPVVKGKDRVALFRRTGARLCDMESAAAMMVAAAHGVPCLAPKVISDTAESGMLAFYRRFEQNIEVLADHLDRLLRDLTELLEELRDEDLLREE
ncbi:MAG: hypothetical protein Kow00109_16380 [Acidobacteriota bacterium]